MKYKDYTILAESTFSPKLRYKDYFISLKRSDIENIKINYNYTDTIIDSFLYSVRKIERSQKLKNILK